MPGCVVDGAAAEIFWTLNARVAPISSFMSAPPYGLLILGGAEPQGPPLRLAALRDM